MRDDGLGPTHHHDLPGEDGEGRGSGPSEPPEAPSAETPLGRTSSAAVPTTTPWGEGERGDATWGSDPRAGIGAGSYRRGGVGWLRALAVLLFGSMALTLGAGLGYGSGRADQRSAVGSSVELPARLFSSGATCSGRPVAGTNLVVTAAHCLDDGAVRRVVYAGREYRVVDQRAHPDYASVPSRYGAAYDVAWVAVDGEFPSDGFAATLASPSELAGARFGPVEALGWSSEYVDRGDGGVAPSLYVCRSQFPTVPVDFAGGVFNVGCGMPPGTSGSGLVVWADGTPLLVGVLSSSNGYESQFHDVSALADILPDDVRRPRGW